MTRNTRVLLAAAILVVAIGGLMFLRFTGRMEWLTEPILDWTGTIALGILKIAGRAIWGLFVLTVLIGFIALIEISIRSLIARVRS